MRVDKVIGLGLMIVLVCILWIYSIYKVVNHSTLNDNTIEKVKIIVESGILEAYELGYRDGVERFYTAIENDCVCILNKTLILDALYGIQFKFENGELEKIEDK